MRRIVIIFSICLIALGCRAKVRLPQFFSDNMVLQQQAECNLWGTADKGKTVKVTTSWDRKTYQVKTDKDGKFELKVQTPEAGGPYEINFNDGKPFLLKNILIGEVWICSGQSNMEMQMKGFKQQPVEGTTEELLRCKAPRLTDSGKRRDGTMERGQQRVGARLLRHGLLLRTGPAADLGSARRADFHRVGRLGLRGMDAG